MELRRFLHKGMSFILLLILGNMLSVTPSGLEKDLYCTNDYVDTMFCHFKPTSDQPDCTEYSLNLTGNILEKPKVHCNFKRREGFGGACCCSIKMIFVLGETHTATLLKGGQELKSKIISIKDSIKPKTPTVKVEETENGNFRVTWKTNYKATTLNDDITSTVTYGKKGEEKTDMVHKEVGTATFFEILPKDLEPSTAYVVSVKTSTSFSKHSSDSSEKCEFPAEFQKDLYCTNDFVDTMFCQFRPTSDQPDCTEYSLNLMANIEQKPMAHCNFKRREGFGGACSCSIKMMLVLGETHNATLLEGGQERESKIISINDSIKPRAPTVKVEVSKNGNFMVTWKTNMEATMLNNNITSTVTYGKKGEKKTDMVHKVVGTATSSVILRKDLQPSTAYVVSVKTFASFSKHSSDSSEECEFTTSDFDIFLAVIISLSFAAVIITSVVFGCYVRFKAKWWDKIAECPNPTLLNMLPGEQKLLQPLQTHFSSIYVDLSVLNDGKPWSKCSLTDTSSESYQQSSGINTGSSSLGYANTLPADIITNVQEALCKALPQLALMSSVTNSSLTESHKDNGLLSTAYSPCSVTQDDLNSPGSSSFDNKTYSILIPSSQQITSGSSENHMQPVVSCDPAYLPSEGDILRNACPDQQVPACLVTGQQDAVLPLVVSSCMQTDFSYQPCNAEDSGLTSVSSGISTSASSDLVSRVEAGCESFDEAVSGATNPTETTQDVYIEKAPICDENPCYGSLPAPSHSFPLVDDDYQAFQSLVKQPNVLFPDQSSGEQLGKYPEEFSSKTAQSSLGTALPDLQIYSAQGGQCPPPDLERPLLSLLSTDHSELVIIDSGYQCV
ncbi:interleukin-4 receptor subunit alpha [Centroberyx gerrardi]